MLWRLGLRADLTEAERTGTGLLGPRHSSGVRLQFTTDRHAWFVREAVSVFFFPSWLSIYHMDWMRTEVAVAPLDEVAALHSPAGSSVFIHVHLGSSQVSIELRAS